jgi:hypothetical protein
MDLYNKLVSRALEPTEEYFKQLINGMFKYEKARTISHIIHNGC